MAGSIGYSATFACMALTALFNLLFFSYDFDESLPGGIKQTVWEYLGK